MKIVMLMTKEVRKKLPALGSQDGRGFEAVAHLKIFDCFGRMTLYVTEFDGDDTLFGYMVSPLGENFDEWGASSLKELMATRNRVGLPLERDRHFTPGPVRDHLEKRHGIVVEKEVTYAHVRD